MIYEAPTQMDTGQDTSTDTNNMLETDTKIQFNCRNKLLLMVEYVCNRNRITHTIENVKFTHKLKKDIVCLSKES
jgi:hypothetical protein